MRLLDETICGIAGLDRGSMEQAQARLDQLTKPQASLGQLEEIAVKLAGISGQVHSDLGQREVCLFAADHGVVAEGVSAFPQEVTKLMVVNFLNGGAAINVFARQMGAGIRLIDIGMVEDLDHPKLTAMKVRHGTANFCKGPAMTCDEAISALEVGIGEARAAKERGVQLLATGEMGIGNTTASSALLAVLGRIPVAQAVGTGTGIDQAGLQRKITAITQGIRLNEPDRDDPVDVLAKVGGLEIAGLAGLILGAAAVRLPVIIDGFISSAAALVAYRLAPESVHYMLASHRSVEPGHQLMLKELGLKPLLFLEMRLGEGTGAVLAMSVVEASQRMIKEMATFAEAGIAAK